MTSKKAHTNGKQIFYLLAIGIVGLLMTAGLGTLLSPALGPFKGHVAGLLIAIVIEGIFASCLRDWMEDGSAIKLVVAIAFGIVSAFADAPVIFSVTRGAGLTVQELTASRDSVVRDITQALSQLRGAKAGADDLAAYSKSKEDEEASQQGGTCNIIGKGTGERYRFRKRDAETFSMQAQTLSGYVDQLAGALNDAQTMTPATSDASLADALRALNGDISTASGAAHNKDLVELAQQFETRSATDGTAQQDTISHVRFVCPDATIAARAKAIASQIEAMPALDQHIVVPNMGDIATTMFELPRRLALTVSEGVGGKDALSGDDLSALVISCLFEFMLVGATVATHGGGRPGRLLRAAARRAAGLKDIDLAAILGAGRELPPDVVFLRRQIEIYRKTVWPLELLVVAHDTGEPGLTRLADAIPEFCALGCAKRHRTIPQWWVRRWVRRNARCDNALTRGDRHRIAKWLRDLLAMPPARRKPWPVQMRDAARFEVFRINIRMLDEMMLASRLGPPDRPAWPASPTPKPPPSDGGATVVSLPRPRLANDTPPDVAAE